MLIADEYIIFVLGVDESNISKIIRDKLSETCDLYEMYNTCRHIALRFEEYDQQHVNTMSKIESFYYYSYTQKVLDEMSKRNLTIKKWTNFNKYFQMLPDAVPVNLRFTEHNNDYLTICYYNLMEKYLRGQKDFSDEIMWNLNEFYARKRHKVAQN